jgi:DNA-binding response OmpR family regulator
MMNILMLDNEGPDHDRLIGKLVREGFSVRVASSELEVIRLFYQDRPDLVIVDTGLLNMPGDFTICRRLHSIAHVSIVLLATHELSEDEVILGLAAGADDYLTRPLHLNVFIARVQALLRRALLCYRRDVEYADGYLRVNMEQHAVYIQGTRVHVTVTEFKLLSTLIRNAGRVMTHRELLEQVWGPHFAGDVHFPRIYINHLRTKLEPDSTHPIYISTERSIGYRFEKRHIS